MKAKKEMMPFRSLSAKEKHNIEEKGVVVVEKNTAALRVVVAIIRIMVYTILLSLAFIGLISIIIPETRNNLLMQANHLFDEFFSLMSGGG